MSDPPLFSKNESKIISPQGKRKKPIVIKSIYLKQQDTQEIEEQKEFLANYFLALGFGKVKRLQEKYRVTAI